MVKMHPPKPTLSNVCTSQRENASTEKEGWENKGKEGAQAGGSYEVQHAVGYIPCLATISIGQDRKYTIEGSSATDKDYPIKTKNGKKKQANQCLSDKIHRSKLEGKNKNEREWAEMSVSVSVCVVLSKVSGLGGKTMMHFCFLHWVK